ncbi:MAG: arginine repressor [Hydrogenibacillus schlegelii]|uniref:Arginine repressor n=1 Tax=Hydrogenibacillus schlegelii TaxID=1484 RepID=A0A947GHM8_HYDSH|nr:arginine repressor [Hydrogenibacillus schlegelii]
MSRFLKGQRGRRPAEGRKGIAVKGKEARLVRIKALVSERVIETQEELVELLRREGFRVTQATVSRDIKALGLVKVPTPEGRYRYALSGADRRSASADKLRRLMLEAFLTVEPAENLLVLKTLPGNANAFGAVIDDLGHPELVGTVCGDDTCLLVCRSAAGALEVRRWLLSFGAPEIGR